MKDISQWIVERRLNPQKLTTNYKNFIPVPASLKDAYNIQKSVVKKLNLNIGGWKLGGTNKTSREIFSCSHLYCGPIDSKNIILSNTNKYFNWTLPTKPQGEAEISFRLSSNIQNLCKLNNKNDVFSYVDALAPSLELPYSVIDKNQNKELSLLISDLCGSGYLVLGDVIPIQRFKSSAYEAIEIIQSSTRLESGSTKNIIGSPKLSLFEFLNFAFENKLKLTKGQWIATGGCTPCTELVFNSRIQVKFQKSGCFSSVILKQ